MNLYLIKVYGSTHRVFVQCRWINFKIILEQRRRRINNFNWIFKDTKRKIIRKLEINIIKIINLIREREKKFFFT